MTEIAGSELKAGAEIEAQDEAEATASHLRPVDDAVGVVESEMQAERDSTADAVLESGPALPLDMAETHLDEKRCRKEAGMQMDLLALVRAAMVMDKATLSPGLAMTLPVGQVKILALDLASGGRALVKRTQVAQVATKGPDKVIMDPTMRHHVIRVDAQLQVSPPAATHSTSTTFLASSKPLLLTRSRKHTEPKHSSTIPTRTTARRAQRHSLSKFKKHMRH